MTTIYPAYPNVTVRIWNGQGAATGPGFQQMIMINQSAVFQNVSWDGGNVRFCIGGNALYSWRENATVWWVLIPGGIPAGSAVAVNMAFLSKSSEYDGVRAGEAPQLSATYAEYDNGRLVFPVLYENFAGTALNYSVWQNVSGGGDYSVNDGLIGVGSGMGAWGTVDSRKDYDNEKYSFDFLADFSSFNGQNLPTKEVAYNPPNTDVPQFGVSDTYGDYSLWWAIDTGHHIVTTSSSKTSSPGMFTLWADSSGPELSLSYGSAYTLNYSVPAEAPVGFGVMQGSIFVQYVRMRTTPPEGIMPSVSFSNPSALSPAYPNVTVRITNSQDPAVLRDFQQMLAINSSAIFQNVSADGGNVRFYLGQQELYSWRENSTVWWVLIPGGIPEYSTVTINMTFLPKSAEYDGYYAGEAPQLSPAYAEYDNGRLAFPALYDNFAGTSLNSTLWQVLAGGSRFKVDDGLTVTGGGSDWASMDSENSYNPKTYAMDFLANYSAFYGDEYPYKMIAYNPPDTDLGATSSHNTTYPQFGLTDSYESYSLWGFNGAGNPTVASTGKGRTSQPSIFTLEANDTGASLAIYYESKAKMSFAVPAAAPVGVGALQGTVFVQYVRMRAAPPDGVMPQAVFTPG
jgi:hypothetical protein